MSNHRLLTRAVLLAVNLCGFLFVPPFAYARGTVIGKRRRANDRRGNGKSKGKIENRWSAKPVGKLFPFSISHLSFGAALEQSSLMTDDKCDMENGKWLLFAMSPAL
jgi:hypothetical protein